MPSIARVKTEDSISAIDQSVLELAVIEKMNSVSTSTLKLNGLVTSLGLKSTGSPEFCTIWTYMGLPAISLPLLKGENNLPLGIQVIGEKYDDNRFLGVCSWLEKESEKFNE